MTDKLNDIVCAPHGTTLPEQQFQSQSAPRAFSRYGQRRPPTRAYPKPELDALQPQVLSKIGASSSFGEEGPPISQGLNGTSNLLDATFKVANGNMSGSLSIVGISPVVDSAPLSQTIVNASLPQLLNGAFHSKFTHSTSNSTTVAHASYQFSGDATFKVANGNMSGSLSIVGISHRVVDSAPLSQNIANASLPQVLNGAFYSKVVHSASNSTGVGIRATNMNCSNRESQQRVDGMGSTPNPSKMSTLIVDSQEHSIADQNKKNRALHDPSHRTGRTPHAIIRQEGQMRETFSYSCYRANIRGETMHIQGSYGIRMSRLCENSRLRSFTSSILWCN
ncbi:hypothetical protein ACH5RR_029956 [Cinchona calisaya]|uniref:Uncharacterized protein n=1 Tax=Cinchona calisaya TaxID=153742 RepID=A0ABD2YWR7_9GENT